MVDGLIEVVELRRGVVLLIFDDAFFENRDDRLLKDDVYGSSLLDLGFFYFRGNVGLLGTLSLRSLSGE